MPPAVHFSISFVYTPSKARLRFLSNYSKIISSADRIAQILFNYFDDYQDNGILVCVDCQTSLHLSHCTFMTQEPMHNFRAPCMLLIRRIISLPNNYHYQMDPSEIFSFPSSWTFYVAATIKIKNSVNSNKFLKRSTCIS